LASLAAVLNTSLLAKSKSRTSHFLTETHAYLANRRIGADMNTVDLAKHLYANYGLKNEADADKVFLASDGIQKLYALGLDDSEIGKIVSQAQWDSKTKSWSSIDRQILQISQERGVNESELSEAISRQNLRQEIDRLKVKKMAQQKIISETDNLSNR
jgi:hypothetical protein